MGGGPDFTSHHEPPIVQATDDDFITVQHIPGSRPSRYTVQIRRYRADQQAHIVSSESEPMGKHEAEILANKWGHWHRLEVR